MDKNQVLKYSMNYCYNFTIAWTTSSTNSQSVQKTNSTIVITKNVWKLLSLSISWNNYSSSN